MGKILETLIEDIKNLSPAQLEEVQAFVTFKRFCDLKEKLGDTQSSADISFDDFPLDDWGIIPKELGTFRREEMYGDDGR